MKIKLDEGARMPTRSHATDAGLDLYAMHDKLIYPTGLTSVDAITGEWWKIPCGETIDTGVHIALEPGTYGKIESRSGLNAVQHIVSCGGVIDEGYTGSIRVVLYNFGREPYMVRQGDKIAQLVIMPYLAPMLVQVDELEETERGANGFGSSGR